MKSKRRTAGPDGRRSPAVIVTKRKGHSMRNSRMKPTRIKTIRAGALKKLSFFLIDGAMLIVISWRQTICSIKPAMGCEAADIPFRRPKGKVLTVPTRQPGNGIDRGPIAWLSVHEHLSRTDRRSDDADDRCLTGPQGPTPRPGLHPAGMPSLGPSSPRPGCLRLLETSSNPYPAGGFS